MSSKNLLIRWQLRRAIARLLRVYARGIMVDVGCGKKQYAALARPFVDWHIGVDHPKTLHGVHEADIAATAYVLPFADGSVDTVLCTEVLEHLEAPSEALHEFWRILQPGGKILVTVPFIWHLHEEPRDFYRYTPYGLRYLADRAGFSVAELRPLNGFWVTWTQLFVYAIYGYNRGPLKWVPLIPLIGLLAQGMGLLLNSVDRRTRWASHHVLVLEKNDGQAS